MEELVSESTSATRYITLLMTVFSILAITLAGIGIYGVISYSVMRQSREIGIRMSLGAERRDVLGMVIRRGAFLLGVGLAGGFAVAVVCTRVLRGMLFGVQSTDTGTFTTVAQVVAAVAIAACYIPARRATRVDPIEALHQE